MTSVPTINTPTTVAQCEYETPESTHSTTVDTENDIETTPAVSTGSAGAGTESSTATVIGAALGGVAAVLLLRLVGVVMGWACTCYKNTSRKQR